DRFEAKVVDADGNEDRRVVRFFKKRTGGFVTDLDVFDAETGEPLIARVPTKHPVNVTSRDGLDALPPMSRRKPIPKDKTAADWQQEAREHNEELLDRIAADMDVARGGDGTRGNGLNLLAPGTWRK